MTLSLHHQALIYVALLTVASGASASERDHYSATVRQSIGGPITPGAKPPLGLSDAQRATIRDAVANRHSDVSFGTAAGKNLESFQPAVGKRIPSSVKGVTLPGTVTTGMPKLKQYTYVKFKDQILIVDPMSRTISDIIPLI
jgi:hypothetical protein